jgi:ribosome recycling factor
MSDLQTAEEKGRKLGVLIASLNISEEEREALLSLLPQMTEAQLEEFTNVLEVKYLQAATKDTDKKLADDLQAVDDKFQEELSKVNADTIKALDSIV